MENLFKVLLIGLLVFFSVENNYSQGFSSKAWPMPVGHQSGLANPGFRIEPSFNITNLGEIRKLVLEMDIKLSTPLDPVAPFAYRYMKNGKIYTDQQLGKDVFETIYLKKADFEVRVQGEGKSFTVLYESVIASKEITSVGKESRTESFAAFVIHLKNVYYGGTEPIEKAIREYEAASKLNQPTVKNNLPSNQGFSGPQYNMSTSKSSKNLNSSQIQNNSNKPQVDSFWSDNPQPANRTEVGRLIPDHPSHKNLPDFVRTTDGGYMYRGSDGRFREVTAEQFAQAKKDRDLSKEPTVKNSTITLEQVQSDIQQRGDNFINNQQAFHQRLDQRMEVWNQNYYHAEAISSGKKNLSDLSTLGNSHSSVEALEAEFNQKYYAIQSEVNNLEQARNAKLSNAAHGYFNENTTEQAIAQGMVLLGNIINSAQAKKEEREAKEALHKERERQLAAIAAAKINARTDLRKKLLASFPDGGTPLSAHKVTADEVYLFAYNFDQNSIANENALVSVSEVFPIQRYSDGTFPYKNIVLKKLKSQDSGEITLVGFYTDKQLAQNMRDSFLNLAGKSSLTIKDIPVAITKSSDSGKITNGDFWETGKSDKPASNLKNTNNSFWEN